MSLKHVPILMYHSISDDPIRSRHPYYETRTSVCRFAQHMTWLRERGYRTIGLDELVGSRSDNDPLTPAVVITFDDGFHDFYLNAFPILTDMGFCATVFLPTAFICDRPVRFQDNLCLTWSDVRQLHSAGITFGSHTVTHPRLQSLRRPEVEMELRCSKNVIEDKLGTKVTSFAYPYSFPEADHEFVSYVESTLSHLGYRTAVNTTIGTTRRGANSLFMKRIPVNVYDDQSLFQAKLDGGYNWLRWPQAYTKTLKRKQHYE